MSNNTNKIRVLIISQQPLLRQGIEHSLSQIEEMEIDKSGMSDGIIASIEAMPPDVAIVDIDGSPDGGLALARRIKQRSSNIGIITMVSNPSDEHIFMALKAQAAACLNKEITAEQLVEVIRRVARGEHPINESLTTRPKLAEQVLHQFQRLSWQSEGEGFMSPLTPREIEILRIIAQGRLNKQIAAELGISEQTIKNHVTSILRKLNANARTEAVVVAIKQGLITIS